MEKDEMTPKLREMMNIMMDMVTPDEAAASAPVQPTSGTRVDYLASPERQELYRKACEFTKTQKRIKEDMLEKRFEIGYGMAALIANRMKAEGLISREMDEEYFYRTL